VGRDDERRFGLSLSSGNANGNVRDRAGRLVTCEHSARRVTRTEYDGSITVIVDRFQGKRLNSPNDVVVTSDGAIWFTDPPFGLGSFYEGTIAEPELNARAVSGRVESVSVPNALKM
jgi:gluconolactonase